MQRLAARGGKKMSCSNAIRYSLGFPLLRRGGVPKAKAAANTTALTDVDAALHKFAREGKDAR